MKTATITLAVTEAVPMPPPTDGVPFSTQAGFRLTLKRLSSGASAALPVENKLVWVIADFFEGEQYELLVESVDSEGRTINAPPLAIISVPVNPTYTRVDSFGIDWS